MTEELLRQVHEISEQYYIEELGLTPEMWRGDDWIEFAHTPQIPHIGIARVFLFGNHFARQRGLTYVYVPNDHLSADLLPESRYIPLFDRNAVKIRRGLLLGLESYQKKQAMFRAPSPTKVSLERSIDRWRRLKFGNQGKIEEIYQTMMESASLTKSLSAWLTRVSMVMLKVRPVIFPTSQLARVFSRGEIWHKMIDHMWKQCGKCGYRLGRTAVECSVCGHSAKKAFELPDVVGRQVIINQLNFMFRLCGRQKPYQEISDQRSLDLYGFKAPERIVVTGPTSAVYRGAKFSRLNLLQFLTLSKLDKIDVMQPEQANMIELDHE